jgi:hypothetical protein
MFSRMARGLTHGPPVGIGETAVRNRQRSDINIIKGTGHLPKSGPFNRRRKLGQ